MKKDTKVSGVALSHSERMHGCKINGDEKAIACAMARFAPPVWAEPAAKYEKNDGANESARLNRSFQ